MIILIWIYHRRHNDNNDNKLAASERIEEAERMMREREKESIQQIKTTLLDYMLILNVIF